VGGLVKIINPLTNLKLKEIMKDLDQLWITTIKKSDGSEHLIKVDLSDSKIDLKDFSVEGVSLLSKLDEARNGECLLDVFTPTEDSFTVYGNNSLWQ